MSEKICELANTYNEIPRETLALSLVDDTLRAVNRVLEQQGLIHRFSLVAPADDDRQKTVYVRLKDPLGH